MSSKENRTFSAPSASWTGREAYLLALVCLLSGLVLGYLFRGSGGFTPTSRASAALTTSGSSTPVSTGADAAPPSARGATAMPSAEALNPIAAPLLAALRVDAKNVETLVQLGNLYYDHQVFPEAIEYYTRVLELRPKDVNVRTDLGTAYWYSGFPEKAVAEYEKSLAVDPKHTNSLFNLGVVRLEGLKDPSSAIAAWEKLLATSPQAPQRQRAIELIAKAKQQKR